MELEKLVGVLTALQKGERLVLTLDPKIKAFDASQLLKVGKAIGMNAVNQNVLEGVVRKPETKSRFIAIGTQEKVPWDDFAAIAAPLVLRVRKIEKMESIHRVTEKDKLIKLIQEVVSDSWSPEEAEDYLKRLTIFPEIVPHVQRKPDLTWEVLCNSHPGEAELFKIPCAKVGWES